MEQNISVKPDEMVNEPEQIDNEVSHSSWEMDQHFKEVVEPFKTGRIVIFLGADVNWCGRPPKDFIWDPGKKFHPSRKELACYLADRAKISFQCNGVNCHTIPDQLCGRMAIQYISEHIDLDTGIGRASEELHDFYSKYSKHLQPNRLHRFLSELPCMMKDKGFAPPYPLIITANYDSILEHAFKNTKPPTPFDLVYYKMTDGMTGKFYHQVYEGETYSIEKPNEYERISFDQRPVILKLYGAMGLENEEGFSDKKYFVVTEDDYINFLSNRSVSQIVPISLLRKLCHSHILFLGYRVRDWHQRVALHRIWHQHTSYKSWAVHKRVTPIDRNFWEKNIPHIRVKVIESAIEDYIDKLEKCIRNSPATQTPADKSKAAESSAQPKIRQELFISYSHNDDDIDWFDRFRKILKPIEQKNRLSVWSDEKINPGDPWQKNIEKALASAKIALLLVSADYLASPFISQQELPFFLEAAEKDGLKIFWVLLRPCLYEETGIHVYQAAHDIRKPLSACRGNTAKEKMVADICREIIKTIGE